MELLILLPILLPLVLIALSITGKLIEPYMNGMKHIDRNKYPILSRAQRILRASNTKKREKEAKIKLDHFNNKRLAIEAATEEKIIKARQKNMTDQANDLYEWDCQLAAITAEEDARKLREASIAEAKKRAAAEIERARLREKELAIWTINEKARIARFEAEQAALKAEEGRRVTELLQQREKDIQALSKHKMFDHDPRNQTLFVVVHGLYVRKLPTKDSRMIDNLSTNSSITVNGWISHEEVWGNPIWFRLANGQGWIWSGGVNTQATTGLENLNYMKRPGETFQIRGGFGDVIRTVTEQSELQTLIDAEIAFLKREKQEIEDRKNDFSRIHTDQITADTIYPQILSAKVRASGYTLDSDGLRGPNLSLTPAQVQELVNDTDRNSQKYSMNERRNFWTGTVFDD